LTVIGRKGRGREFKTFFLPRHPNFPHRFCPIDVNVHVRTHIHQFTMRFSVVFRIVRATLRAVPSVYPRSAAPLLPPRSLSRPPLAPSLFPTTPRPLHSSSTTLRASSSADPSNQQDQQEGTTPENDDLSAWAAGDFTSSPDDEPKVRAVLYGIPGPQAEELSDLLLVFGALSVGLEEDRAEGAPEQKIYDTDEKVWDTCRLVAIYPADSDLDESLLGPAEAVLGFAPRLTTEEVVSQEWEEVIKASYVPLEICPGCWIVPAWCEAPPASPSPSSSSSPSPPIHVILEPGLAFGTGEHPTTRLCFRELRRAVRKGATVMDYGTGSGILALAALHFGAKRAVGTDVDPLAVESAGRNAALNHMEGRYSAYPCRAALSDPEPLGEAGVAPGEIEGAFDIVAANILKGPVLDLAPRLAMYARRGSGRLVLSGILAEQAAEVVRKYDEWFTGLEVETEGEWACVRGVRRP
jgi:ribosomal protein L11 methyltransferase